MITVTDHRVFCVAVFVSSFVLACDHEERVDRSEFYGDGETTSAIAGFDEESYIEEDYEVFADEELEGETGEWGWEEFEQELTAEVESTLASRTIGPRDNFRHALQSLRPGDRLRLRSGTYNIGDLNDGSLRITPGRSNAPIIVEAADRNRPPLLRGSLRLSNADYWFVRHIRMQGTTSKPALTMYDGRGWRVENSEFWGARNTGAYANVSIGGNPNVKNEPRRFAFQNNCVHDAGKGPNHMFHNLYVNFAGSSQTNGKIVRNIFWGNSWGSGVKLGAGGKAGARGPWNVVVNNNTFSEGAKGIVLHGDVRNNYIGGNIFYQMHDRADGGTRHSVGIYSHWIYGGNAYRHNYGYNRPNLPPLDPDLNFTRRKGPSTTDISNRGDNGVRPDPRFNRIRSCTGYRPRGKARAYGKYGTNQWPRW